MSTIREFVAKWLGKGYDHDQSSKDKYKFQCVDLVKIYLKEVFGVIPGSFGDAADAFRKETAFKYKFDFYERNFRPNRGDVIFFKKAPKNQNAGHIGIVLASDETKIYYLDQNGGLGRGTGAGKDAITIRVTDGRGAYAKSEIIGFARYKNIDEKIEEDLFDKIVFKHNIYIWEGNGKVKTIDGAIKIFYSLASVSKLGDKDYKDIIVGNPDVNATRKEILQMILNYINKVKYGFEKYKFSDLEKLGVWNGKNENSEVTGFEFSIMVYRAKDL